MTDKTLTTPRKRTITIMGNIGCGKTTLLDMIATRNDIPVMREALIEWKPFLEKFYEDRTKYALSLQLVILHTMNRDRTVF